MPSSRVLSKAALSGPRKVAVVGIASDAQKTPLSKRLQQSVMRLGARHLLRISESHICESWCVELCVLCLLRWRLLHIIRPNCFGTQAARHPTNLQYAQALDAALLASIGDDMFGAQV